MKSAVVLLHGQPGGARDWELVVPLLDGLDVLAQDRPGYDGTPARGFAGNAAAVLHRMDEAGIERAVLAGYSWGGGVALATALAAPDRVAALALIASVGTTSSYDVLDRLLGSRIGGRLAEFALRRLAPRFGGALARSLGSPLDTSRLASVQEGFEVARHGPAWSSWRAEQRALVRALPWLATRLGEIRAPAVVLVATRDRAVSPAAQRELAGRLPRAAVHEVAAGHLVPFEAPQAVAAAIRAAVELAS